MPSVTTLPLAVGILRLVGAPVLLLVAALGQANAFWSVLGVMLVSDVLDGWLARRLNATPSSADDSTAPVITRPCLRFP